MKRFVLASCMLAAASVASAAVSINTSLSGSTYSVDVTTATIFDTIEVGVTGAGVSNVTNAVSGLLGPGIVFDTATFTQLGTLGLTTSDPFVLTLGVLQPLGNDWVAGLTNELFMTFDLASGSADVFVNLLDNGQLVDTTTITVGDVVEPVIPEPTSMLVFAGLAAVAGLRRGR